MSNVEHYPKHNIPVHLSLSDGSHALGVVYVRQGQRILDMLCDEREFFPVRSREGVSLVNKHCVIKVHVLSIADIAEREELFPGVNLAYLKNNNW